MATVDTLPYTLCKPFSYTKCFRVASAGEVKPLNFVVEPPQPWLHIESVKAGRNQLFEIANQCPAQGGMSVYRARYYISLFNDSIEYDDLNICLNQGYYREMTPSGISSSTGKLVVVPNLTSGKATLNIEGANCKINIVRIVDTFGKLVWQINLPNPTLTYELQLIDNPSGLYIIEAICDSGVVYHSKLLIVK